MYPVHPAAAAVAAHANAVDPAAFSIVVTYSQTSHQ
jgi:hypothetical protein